MIKRVVLACAVFAAVRSQEHDEEDFEFPSEEAGFGEENPEVTQEMLEQQTNEDFKAMDSNDDGEITREEIEAYLNDPAMKDEIDRFFEQADTDKNGIITKPEYLEFVKNLLAQYQAEAGMDGLDFGEEDEL
jgi:hypothetical protein